MKQNSNSSLFFIDEIQRMCKTEIVENTRPHLHDYYSIFWIQKGEAVHATNFIEYIVHPQSIIFVPAGLTHKMVLNDNTAGYTYLFNDTFFRLNEYNETLLNSGIFNNPDFYTIVKVDKEENTRFASLTDFMMKTKADESNPHRNDILLHLLVVFLLEAKRLHENQYKQEKTTFEENPHSLIIEFKKLIETHFRTAKDVSFYADQLNIRVASLNDNVKKITGITSGELIRYRIIDEAKKLLYTSDKNAKEIAFELGFEDPAYFSRFFKKYTNSTLSDFRELLVKKYNKTVF